jgi:hypothetical protein
VYGGGRRGPGAAVDCSATHTTSRPSAKQLPIRKESCNTKNDDSDDDGDSDSNGSDSYGSGGRGGARSGSDDDDDDKSSDADSMQEKRHTKPKIINITSTSTSASTSTSSATPGTPKGIVTMKSSDTILGHILRHVEKSMVTLGKDMKNKNENENFTYENEKDQKNENGNENSGSKSRTRTALPTHGSTSDKVPNENLSAIPSQSCKESSVERSSIVMKNKGDLANHPAHQICRCIFVLFTETPALNIASNILKPLSSGIRNRIPRIANRIKSNTEHSIDLTGHGNRKVNSNVSTGGLRGIRDDDDSSSVEILDSGSDARNVPKMNILLRNVSERRRCQALSMATKYISHCNRDCLRLLRDISLANKARNILSSSTHLTSTRHDGSKRKRSEDDVWGDSFEMRGKGKGKVRGKSKKRGYGFSDSEDEEEEVVLEKEGSDEIDKEKGIEQDIEKEKESVCDVDDDDSDIEVRHSLKPTTAPAPPTMFVHPKGVIPYVPRAAHTPYSFLEALLAVTKPSSVLGAKEWFFNKTPHEQKKIVGNSKNSDPSSSTSSKQNSNSNSNKNKNENENENENKKNPGNNTSSDKHAHSLIFKIEELEWRLLQLIRELDKQRQVQCNKKRKVRSTKLFYIFFLAIFPPVLDTWCLLFNNYT